MQNTKRIITIGIVILALIVLGRTIYGSVFYASNDGGSLVDVNDGGNLPGVEEESPVITTGTVTTGATSPQGAAVVTAPKPVAPRATTTPVRVTPTNTPSLALPTRLLIPKLSIDANVQYVTINAKGNMGTPNNFTDVSWYKPGTVPGQVGSAVMAGHVDNGVALSGVFKRLYTLKVGDDVYVTQKDGSKLHFKVERIATYPYTAVPVETVFAAKDAKRLNLVTCVGTWLADLKTYSERLIVYTKLVE